MARKKTALMALIICLTLSAPLAFSLEKKDVSFYISFEKGLQPDIARGKTDIKVSAGTLDDVTFVPGRRGRAAKVTDAFNINYTNKDIFSKKEGTISFWMMPIGCCEKKNRLWTV